MVYENRVFNSMNSSIQGLGHGCLSVWTVSAAFSTTYPN